MIDRVARIAEVGMFSRCFQRTWLIDKVRRPGLCELMQFKFKIYDDKHGECRLYWKKHLSLQTDCRLIKHKRSFRLNGLRRPIVESILLPRDNDKQHMAAKNVLKAERAHVLREQKTLEALRSRNPGVAVMRPKAKSPW
jgi:hypothetical protein